MIKLDLFLEGLYDRDNLFLDVESIRELCDLLIDEEKLNSFIKSILFKKSREKGLLASYYPVPKELNVYIDNINHYFSRKSLELDFYMSETDDSNLYNTIVLMAILHEIEHANQEKKATLNSEQESLDKIIIEGMEFGRRTPSKLTIREKIKYCIFYKKILFERNAEIIALYKLLKLDDRTGILSFEQKNNICKELSEYSLYGYKLKHDKIESPSESYYKLRKKEDEYSSISFKENYNNLTKLSWGMPIEKDLFGDLKIINKYREHTKIMEILK